MVKVKQSCQKGMPRNITFLLRTGYSKADGEPIYERMKGGKGGTKQIKKCRKNNAEIMPIIFLTAR